MEALDPTLSVDTEVEALVTQVSPTPPAGAGAVAGLKGVVLARNLWGIAPKAQVATQQYMDKIKMTHGMFASVPLLCQDMSCPYADTCEIPQADRTFGGRCPQEAAIIMARFEMYCDHFGIDLSNLNFRPGDVVDAGLVRDLVDLEVQMFRAENKMAIRGDFLGSTINTVDNKGKAWYEDAVTPEAAFKNSLFDKRFKILNLLNSTRKDKAAMAKALDNPSVKAASLFKKISEARQANGLVADVYEETPVLIVSE